MALAAVIGAACCCDEAPGACPGCPSSVLVSWGGSLTFFADLCACSTPGAKYTLDETFSGVSIIVVARLRFLCTWVEFATISRPYAPCTSQPALNFELNVSCSLVEGSGGVWTCYLSIGWKDWAAGIDNRVIFDAVYVSDGTLVGCPYMGSYTRTSLTIVEVPTTWVCPSASDGSDYHLAELLAAAHPTSITVS